MLVLGEPLPRVLGTAIITKPEASGIGYLLPKHLLSLSRNIAFFATSSILHAKISIFHTGSSPSSVYQAMELLYADLFYGLSGSATNGNHNWPGWSAS